MTIQPEHPTSKHRATAQEAARAAQEVLAKIEKLRAAAQAAADSEKCTQWLTRHAQHLEELARKAQHLADAATEACVNAGHLDGEHLVEVTATACRARDDLYRVYFSITA
ncbi:hypothetical protein E7Z53_17055 [Kocuria salina]|uniref:hypothetical protein n=1 Tax=Kocuria salina TaxID=1929416 RepID=UPI001593C31E|nr:hypothetical protein [Kocuria salina]NVC25133.1 hypothetical protein [Kocuria salina]